MAGLDSRAGDDQQRAVLEQVLAASLRFLGDLSERPVNARYDVDEVAAALGGPLPEHGAEPLAVIGELLAGGRTRGRGHAVRPVLRLRDRRHPAGRARRGLAACDLGPERGHLRLLTAGAGVEEVAASGCSSCSTCRGVGRRLRHRRQMANFTCLAAARHAVLRRAGWDVESRRPGRRAAHERVLVAPSARHHRRRPALPRPGRPRDRRCRPTRRGGCAWTRLRELLATLDGPTIVCLQAGNVNTGAFDPLREAIGDRRTAGAWLHVDGAFGLWARASRGYRHWPTASSWPTPGPPTRTRWLNVPYDCGVAIVAPRRRRSARR